MTWYRYCDCHRASFPVDDWKSYVVETQNGPYTGWRCRRCRARREEHGEPHFCASLAHPIEGEVFGPPINRSGLLAIGWELPMTWASRLGLQARSTLLRLCEDGLLASYVYDANLFFMRRMYRAAASLDDLHASVARHEISRGLAAIKRTYRPLLDAADIPYQLNSRRILSQLNNRRFHQPHPTLLVPIWVAPIVEAKPPRCAFHPDDNRPAWQKLRLYRIAALQWASADDKRRDALEAIMMTSKPNGAATAQRLIAAQVTVDPSTPYTFARAGERTFESVRLRRSQAK